MTASTRIPLAAITRAGAAQWLPIGTVFTTEDGDWWPLTPERDEPPEADWSLDTTDPLVQTAACVLLLRLRGRVPKGMTRAFAGDGALVVADNDGIDAWSAYDVLDLATCTTLAEALAAVVMWELERAGEVRHAE